MRCCRSLSRILHNSCNETIENIFHINCGIGSFNKQYVFFSLFLFLIKKCKYLQNDLSFIHLYILCVCSFHFFKSKIATNGIIITAVTLYFMKDLLVTIIQSIFKYILNPTIWSRVVADINAQPAESFTPNVSQRIEMQFDSDIRDINVSKALDVANQQNSLMHLILEQKKIELSQLQPSGIEMLAVKESSENTSRSDLSPASSSVASRTEFSDENTSKSEILPVSSSAETASQMSESSAGSTYSFEAFQVDDIAASVKLRDSLISLTSTVTDSVPTTVSIGDSQSSGNPSEHSATISSTNSNKSVDELSDGTASSDSDSVEILSISSGTASS